MGGACARRSWLRVRCGTPPAKQLGLHMDMFMFGLPVLGLLLFWGDVQRLHGCNRLLDALSRPRHVRRVPRGGGVHTRSSTCSPSTASMRDLQSVRVLVEETLLGVALDEDAIRAGIASWQGTLPAGALTMGCGSTLESSLLVVRGLRALVAGQTTDASRAALRAAADAGAAADAEGGSGAPRRWRRPAAMRATLRRAARQWQVALDVSEESILAIEAFNHFLRVEAHRLHGARSRRGQATDARAAAERAVAEAGSAKYVWLELLSLNDLCAWCSAAERADDVAAAASCRGAHESSPEELAILKDLPL